jgi:hypothetical protein
MTCDQFAAGVRRLYNRIPSLTKDEIILGDGPHRGDDR